MKFIFAILCFYNLLFSAYFDVWDEKSSPYQKLPESFVGYYDETLKIWNKSALSAVTLNSEGETFEFNAIITTHTDLRAWPSKKPLFRDRSKAGEGYPFDYAQHSALYVGMPIKILRKSADKRWYFAITPVNYGWIDIEAVALIDKDDETILRKMSLCTPINDDEIMQDEISTTLKVGMALPCNEDFTFVPVRQSNGYVIFLKSPKIPKIPIDEQTRQDMALRLLGKPYGWGGIYGDRDCSALTRDIFIGAGVFLKRNSKQQANPNANGYIDLSKYSVSEKKNIIIQTAIPWKTLLYMPGHIVLYIGHENGEPLIYQAVWGIKTFDLSGTEGRFIIGETIISTLDINKSIKGYDLQKSSLAPKIIGMRTITIN